MRQTKQIILSHKTSKILESKLLNWEQKGWKRSSPIYPSENGLFCIQMNIEQRPTIYTSIAGILYLESDKKQKQALDKYLTGKFTDIKFIPSAVNNLISLLESTDSLLKVHSMWRYRLFGESEKMMSLFLSNGFKKHHLHKDFFVRFKGKNGVKEYDIEFSASDDSSVNVVIDTRKLDLPPSFVTYTPRLSTGLSADDVEEIKCILNDKYHRSKTILGH